MSKRAIALDGDLSIPPTTTVEIGSDLRARVKAAMYAFVAEHGYQPVMVTLGMREGNELLAILDSANIAAAMDRVLENKVTFAGMKIRIRGSAISMLELS